MKRKTGLPPIHPGEIIKEDILPSLGLSATAAAEALGVSRQMLHDILSENKPLSAVMCLRVSRLFGSSPEMWMLLQAAYDLKKAKQNKKVMQRVARIVPVKPVGGSSGLNVKSDHIIFASANGEIDRQDVSGSSAAKKVVKSAARTPVDKR